MTTPAPDLTVEHQVASEQTPQLRHNELIAIVLRDQTLDVEAKLRLLNDLKRLRPPSEDRWVYWIAVAVLGAVAVATVLTMALSANPAALPQALLALGSAAIGALAGVLTPGSKARNE